MQVLSSYLSLDHDPSPPCPKKHVSSHWARVSCWCPALGCINLLSNKEAIQNIAVDIKKGRAPKEEPHNESVTKQVISNAFPSTKCKEEPNQIDT